MLPFCFNMARCSLPSLFNHPKSRSETDLEKFLLRAKGLTKSRGKMCCHEALARTFARASEDLFQMLDKEQI